MVTKPKADKAAPVFPADVRIEAGSTVYEWKAGEPVPCDIPANIRLLINKLFEL